MTLQILHSNWLDDCNMKLVTQITQTAALFISFVLNSLHQEHSFKTISADQRTFEKISAQTISRTFADLFRSVYVNDLHRAICSKLKADSHLPQQPAFSTVDRVNAEIEYFLSLCGNATVHWRILTSVTSFKANLILFPENLV